MSTRTTSALRQRMIDDMTARKLAPQTQHLHIASCKRFAAFLQRSPETATADDICRFQLHLAVSGMEIPYRNRIVTGVKFLFRVTLRRHDLAAEIYHLTEPQKIPVVMSQAEVKRLLAAARTLKFRTMLSLTYGCGLRISEIVKLRVGDIDSEQNIIRIVQTKGRKDRHVMLPPEVLNCSGNGGVSVRQNMMPAYRKRNATCSQAGSLSISARANFRACSGRLRR
jgi:integrase/recombinase XerD